MTKLLENIFRNVNIALVNQVAQLCDRMGLDVWEVVVNGAPLRSTPLTAALLGEADCVLILADHSCFDYAGIVRDARMVFDVRNATRNVADGREKIIRL
jgi:UDP-N-acetyl-D-mannosaminuronate dehydrogenase